MRSAPGPSRRCRTPPRTPARPADDIGFWPFPSNATAQYAVIGGDYNLAVSKNSKNKATAQAWIDWFVDESGYTEARA